MRLARVVLLRFVLLWLLSYGFLNGQVANGESRASFSGPPIQAWTAQWITCPNAPERDAFLFHFRKVLDLPRKPAHFLVNVSADNQFLFHVNRQRVGTGPDRSDLAHWRYETYDLAPYLHSGRNILAATVWGFGTRAPYAQMSDRAGFLLHGAGEGEVTRVADTNETWDVEEDNGLQAPPPSPEAADFNGAEPGERIDAQAFDWLWDADPDNAGGKRRPGQWKKASVIDVAVPRGGQMQSTNWQLVADRLPPMTMEPISAGKTVRSSGFESAKTSLGFPDKPLSVPPHSKVSLLIDVSHLTTGYPELTVSGGRGATIHQTYAEALITEKGDKGNRNDIASKHIAGLSDEFLPDGSSHLVFLPLAWRAWRYLQIDIDTADEPLQVDRLRTWFTAYPFEERGYFHSDGSADDSSLASIWDIGWRTARLDAHDTYMDTPYWERMQYVGDTRIQALISYVVAGDDRLARQAIEAFNNSRIPDGITWSQYPSKSEQYIPTFSLLWVGMLHDFWLYRGGADFVREQLPGTRTVLDWFLRHQRPDGLLGRLPWWTFVDWANDFDSGVPPQDADGGSVVMTLQYVEALRYAAAMEATLGDQHRAAEYETAAEKAATPIRKLCWNEKYGLFADTPAQTHFSQHANILAAWLDIAPQDRQQEILTKILSNEMGTHPNVIPPAISKATYYFRFYLARAIDHAGMGDQYLALLQPWRDMAALGLTTWAETPEPTRSDSHAWSAHPNYDLLTIVAGIRPKTPGFASVTIAPHLGSLPHVTASMPIPAGDVRVEYTRKDSGTAAIISLPPEVSGELVWQGKTYKLRPGEQQFLLPPK